MSDLHFFSIGDNLNATGHYGFVQRGHVDGSKIADKLFEYGDSINKMVLTGKTRSMPTP